MLCAMTAYRMETERLVVRCFSPEDAPKLKDAIDVSLDHLRAWMPWAKDDPEPVDAKVELLRRFRGDFDLGNAFLYGIFSADDSVLLGGTGLHPRIGPNALEIGYLEIGYWVRRDEIGKGLATEAVAAVVRVGFEVHKIGRIEIHCDPANVRSAAIPRKLGFTLDATLPRRAVRPDGSERDTMIWRLFATDYAASAASNARVAAFDAARRRLF
jgi:RimJ/RimL family protein N-acetyltransferase